MDGASIRLIHACESLASSVAQTPGYWNYSIKGCLSDTPHLRKVDFKIPLCEGEAESQRLAPTPGLASAC